MRLPISSEECIGGSTLGRRAFSLCLKDPQQKQEPLAGALPTYAQALSIVHLSYNKNRQLTNGSFNVTSDEGEGVTSCSVFSL